MFTLRLLSLFSLSFIGAFAADPSSYRGADAALHDPFDLGAHKAAVLIFYLHDCPVCNAYAPELERIRQDYKDIAFFIVQTDSTLSASGAVAHAEEYGLKSTILLDPTRALARFCGATVTPQAAVIGPERKVLYLGRIDDLFAELGKRRAQPTTRDLRNALDAVLAGRAAPAAAGPAVGCFIPDDRSSPPEKAGAKGGAPASLPPDGGTPPSLFQRSDSTSLPPARIVKPGETVK